MRRLRSASLLAGLLLAALPIPGAGIDAAQYLEDVKTLSSAKFKGRLSGTRELDEAAQWLAARFQEIGLRPPPGGFLQRFHVTTAAQAGRSTRLSYTLGGKTTVLKLSEEYTPLGLSSNGAASGPLVFAGYGITAPEYGYDDYAGLDVRGKVVVILRHEPQEYDDRSVFGGRVYTNHAQIESKAVNALRHGAAALILVDDAPSHRGSAGLEKLGNGIGPDAPGIPAVEIKPAIFEKWLEAAGQSFEKIIEGIDEDLRPRSFAFPAALTVDLTVDLHRETRPVYNVLAWLPGTTEEYVIACAHYDHVGLGQQYSMDPSRRGEIHPGADDNASGTAGVLALARWFAAQPPPRRGILFIAFGGEEFGLLGSNYYLRNPVLPLSNAVAVINLDMIGRMRDNKLYVGGAESSPGFKQLIAEMNRNGDGPFEIEDDDTGDYGSSDHFALATAEIPYLFFFTGLHPDYHTPRDTWDRINAAGAARVLQFVSRILEHLVQAPDRPPFQRRSR